MLTVKFVDNETFDSLPYKNAGTSLGVADRNRGVAYVRDTGNPMDIFTAYHELEHLKGEDWEEHASPNEDGVYYKEFGSIMENIAPIFGAARGNFNPMIQTASAAAGLPMLGNIFGGGKKDQQQSQQATQQQFNPATSMTSQQSSTPAAPATSSVGGGGVGGNSMGGGLGQGAVGKMRSDQELAQSALRSKGFYGGR